MEISREAEERIVRYLLGELAAGEAHDIESAYFLDDGYFECVQAVEGDLIRSFVTGTLSPDLRLRFENRCRQSPELSRKVGFARAVAAVSRDVPRHGEPIVEETQRSWISRVLRFEVPRLRLVTAAVVATLAVVAVFAWRGRQSRPDLAQINAPATRPPNVELPPREQRPTEAPRGPRSPDLAREQQRSPEQGTRAEGEQKPVLLAAVVLQPGLTRDQGQSQTVQIPRIGKVVVQFELPLPPNLHYANFQVVLQRLPAPTISTSDVPTKDVIDSGRALTFRIAGDLVPAGQYILHVKGRNAQGHLDDLQYYIFSVPQ